MAIPSDATEYISVSESPMIIQIPSSKIVRTVRRTGMGISGVAFVIALTLQSRPLLAGKNDEPIDFNAQIAPILSDRCYHCHGPDAVDQESNFRADTKENLFADLGGYSAVVPGDLNASEIHKRIRSVDPDVQMPPPRSQRSLTEAERTLLDRWIEQGASYQGHWSFELPVRPDVPVAAVREAATSAGWDPALVARWLHNPIDVFVAKKLLEQQLSPAPEAAPATMLRRASLTLTGLMPSTELQQRWSANATEETYDFAIEELLNSMAYAERQTLRWLDAARYADTDGYQVDFERTNWPWRDWVIQAYHKNMPFDQFTIEQIAGDMLPGATESQQLASAFNRNHRQNAEGGALPEEFFVENVIDRVETTSTVFLGLTVGCARCHDHKYDPLSQREFYQMFGYFNNIGEIGFGRGLDANPTLKTVSPLSTVEPQWVQTARAAEQNLEIAKQGMAQRLQDWIAEQDAPTSVKSDPQPSDLPSSSAVDANSAPIVAEATLDPQIGSIFAKPPGKRTAEDHETLRQHYETIDQPFKVAKDALDVANQELLKHDSPLVTVMVMRERDGDPLPSYLLQRGQYDQPVTTEPLPRGVPTALLLDGETQPRNRLEFARWLVSRNNPLTARVTVNRIWQDHFGTGLVKTTEDFGMQGEQPSHRELLDWLAVEFIESGWNVKALQKLIVTSAAYRQASQTTDRQLAIDPENRWLSHGPRFRVDGFVIRDLALQASGLLVEKPGGPSVKPYQPDGLWAVIAADIAIDYQVGQGADLYRKSMYGYWKRAVNPPQQTIFDAGGREVCNVRVRRTNTPLQALALMNDPTFVESARRLAERVLKLPRLSDEQRINELVRLALSRECDSAMMVILQSNLNYFREHFATQPTAAEQLLSVGTSPRDKYLNATEHAALTATAHLILNLDEFMSIE